MPATQTHPRRPKTEKVPASQVKEMLLKLAYRMHATKPVGYVPAAAERR